MTFSGNSDWLAERLFERRVVVCRGKLDDDSESATTEAAWTLIDVLDLLGVPVRIVCSGRVEGAAIAVLTAAEHVRALPHTRFQLSDPELEIAGRASELGALVDHHSTRLRQLHERVAIATGRSIDTIAADVEAKRALDAEEALAYGLIDEIAGSTRPLRAVGSSPAGGRSAKRGRTTEKPKQPLGFDPGSKTPGH